MKTKHFAGAALVAAITLTAPSARGATLEVPAQFPTIQEAVNAASTSDEILIAPGIYVATAGPLVNVTGKPLVIRGSGGRDATVLDGAGQGPVVLVTGAPVTLESLTITRGAANWGGGVYVNMHASVDLVDCLVTGNSAGSGGGLAAYYDAWIRLTRSVVTGNAASYAGGGGFAYVGGIHAVSSEISGNVAGSYGGGLAGMYYCGGVGADNSIIRGNTAQIGGGSFSGFDSRCGSGTWLANTIVTGNTATAAGGGVAAMSGTHSHASLFNTTIAGNTAPEGGGLWTSGSNEYLTNMIIWGNSSAAVLTASVSLPDGYTWYGSVRGSIVEGAAIPPEIDGGRNLDADPLFVDGAAGDFHLTAGSPAIDLGFATDAGGYTPAPATDLDGMARPQGASWDAGAFEFDSTPPAITIVAPADGAAYVLRQPVAADWTATDGGSGVASATGTVPSGALVDTGTVGTKTFQVTALDVTGNSATASATYDVRYAFGGVLSPLKADGTGTSKLGSPLPVKFRLLDWAAAAVPTAVARLFVAPLVSGVPGAESPAVPSGAGQAGNAFRFDPLIGQYVFTMSTRGMTAGTWQLRIALDDGTSQRVAVTLM